MHGEHRPLGEPATPSGSAGSSGLATTALALATATRVRRRNSEVTTLCLFAFYSDNAVAAVASSETTEPSISKRGQSSGSKNGPGPV